MPGPEDGDPELLGRFRGGVCVSLRHPQVDQEPFLIRHGAGQTNVGTPCGNPGNRLFADDPVLGARMEIRGRFSTAPSVGVLLLGSGVGVPELVRAQPHCHSYVDFARSFWMLPFAVSQPSWEQTVEIPNAPSLHGLEFLMQVFYLNTTEYLRLTQGIHARVGL